MLYARDGRPMVEIPGHDGVHEYVVLDVTAGVGRDLVELRREDGDDIYTVKLLAGGATSCTCKDYRYRRDLYDCCKHATAARKIVDAMAAAAKLLKKSQGAD
jgi:hypothetical protein